MACGRFSGVPLFGILVLFSVSMTSCFILVPPGVRRFKQRHVQRSDYEVTRIDLRGVIGWRYGRIKGSARRIGAVIAGGSGMHYVMWRSNDRIALLTATNDGEKTIGFETSDLGDYASTAPLPRMPPRAWVLGLGGERDVYYAPRADGGAGTTIRKKVTEAVQGLWGAERKLKKHLNLQGVMYTNEDKVRIRACLIGYVVNSGDREAFLCHVEREEVGPRLSDYRYTRRHGIFFPDEDRFVPLSVQEFRRYGPDDACLMTPVLCLDLQRNTAVVSRKSSALHQKTFWLLRLSDWKAVKLVEDNYQYVTSRLSPRGDKLMYLCKSLYSGWISNDSDRAYEKHYPPEMYVIDLTQAHKDLDSYLAADFKEVDPGFRRPSAGSGSP